MFVIAQVSAPTAAGVSVAGSIMTADGSGIRNVQVALVESDGTRHFTITGSFGNYQFEDIVAGQTVVLMLNSKSYTFQPSTRLITLNEELTDFDWIAQE